MKDSTVFVRDYAPSELNEILEHPETVRRDPYKLFTAYVWDGLLEEFMAEDGDEIDGYEDSEDMPVINIEGRIIELSFWNRLFTACVNDLIGAASTGGTLQIRGKSYRIPDQDFPLRKLRAIFAFKRGKNTNTGEDIIVICKEDIKELTDKAGVQTKLEANREDKLFFKKLVYLAEDDDNDGWDKLTDIEVAVYYWGFKLDKFEGDPAMTVDITKVLSIIEEESGIDWQTLEACMKKPIKKAEINVKAQFSAEKIRKWNKKNKQASIVDNIDVAKAEEYWESGTQNFKKARL